MSAKLEKTRTPGVYKRGGRYVVVYYFEGKQRRESAPNFEVARKLKAAREADVARGEFHEQSRTSFAAYATEWVERYQGRGRGFRESTRDNYRSDLTRYAIPWFGSTKRLAQITPRDIANFIAWLCDESAQAEALGETSSRYRPVAEGRRKKRLSDSSVANIVKPVRACLGTAVAEGLLRQNPARDVPMPHRPSVETSETDEIRALSREQLAAFLGVVHPKHRTLFRFLASTGLRVSEVAALQWCHLQAGRRQASCPRAPAACIAAGFSRPSHGMGDETCRSTIGWWSSFGRYGVRRAGPAMRTSCLPTRPEARSTRTTCGDDISDRPQRRQELRGRRFTRSVIHAPRSSLSAAPAWSRSSGGSGTIPRRSR